MAGIYERIKDLTARRENGVEYIYSDVMKKEIPVYKYLICLSPKRPCDWGKSYGCTPILEQCKNVVKLLEEDGGDVFVKCITTGGREIWLV